MIALIVAAFLHALSPTPVAAYQPAELQAAHAVSHCESEHRNVKNPKSTASGHFQFINGTWEWVTGLRPPAMAYPYRVQLAAFVKLWDGGKGRSHWAASASCWAPLLP